MKKLIVLLIVVIVGATMVMTCPDKEAHLTAINNEFSLLPSQGYSLLVRAKRYGRWWLLKTLKEPYRHDSMYQTLLRKEYEITCQLQHPMVVTVVSLEEVKDCCQAVQRLTFVGTENSFSSEHERQ